MGIKESKQFPISSEEAYKRGKIFHKFSVVKVPVISDQPSISMILQLPKLKSGGYKMPFEG